MKSTTLLAAKYAKAFIAAMPGVSDAHQVNYILQAQKLLKHNPSLLAILTAPTLKPHDVEHLINRLVEQSKLSSSLKKLFLLLALHKRLALLPEVLGQLAQLMQETKNTETLHISSSHAMTQEALESVVAFFARKTGKHIVYTHSVDTSLIAGIRLQSSTYLWEHSVRKQLHALRLPLIKGHYEY